MLRRLLLVASLGVAILAIWRAWQTPKEAPPRVPGRNNTILFFSSDASGLSNVHVASSSALVEFHPEVEVHYASFPRLESKISHVSSAACAKNALAQPIQWHELPGPGFVDGIFPRRWDDANAMIRGLGERDFDEKINDLIFLQAPYTVDEHIALYRAIAQLVDDIDPSLIVLDNTLIPAMDFARNSDRLVASICPNWLLDVIADAQPWLAMFWKYPAYVLPITTYQIV
jgi:hypothetical protein